MTDDLRFVNQSQGQSRAHHSRWRARAKVGSITGGFRVTIPRCAQKCAQSIAAKLADRIAELIVDVSLRGEGGGFSKPPPKFAFAKETRPIRKCLCRVYLQA